MREGFARVVADQYVHTPTPSPTTEKTVSRLLTAAGYRRGIRVEPSAPPQLRALAAYLHLWAAFSEVSIGELAAAAGVDTGVINAIVSAMQLPNRQQIDAIIDTCGADPAHTHRLLYAAQEAHARSAAGALDRDLAQLGKTPTPSTTPDYVSFGIDWAEERRKLSDPKPRTGSGYDAYAPPVVFAIPEARPAPADVIPPHEPALSDVDSATVELTPIGEQTKAGAAEDDIVAAESTPDAVSEELASSRTSGRAELRRGRSRRRRRRIVVALVVLVVLLLAVRSASRGQSGDDVVDAGGDART